MWKMLPKGILFKGFGYLFVSLVLVSIFYIFDYQNMYSNSGEASFFSFLKITIPTTLIFLAIVFFLGKVAWKLPWNFPVIGKLLNQHVCPNLNGQWTGEIISNFPKDESQNKHVEVAASISADMFGFTFSLGSANGYQTSTVTQSEIIKDPKTKSFYLEYIFEAEVPVPEGTDDRVFDGAGKLKVIMKNGIVSSLSGTYWTNRAWQRGLNTAGRINLYRDKDKS